MEKRPKKLLDQVRDAIRVKHYSIRTEEAYVDWIKRFIFFHNQTTTTFDFEARNPDKIFRHLQGGSTS